MMLSLAALVSVFSEVRILPDARLYQNESRVFGKFSYLKILKRDPYSDVTFAWSLFRESSGDAGKKQASVRAA